MIDNRELPIGFTMELAQHSNALIQFSNMSRADQQSVIEGAKQIQSPQEMRNYVEGLTNWGVTTYEKNRFI